MSSDKADSSESKNSWITPTIITAVIGLIGTLVTLYVGYLTTTRPIELALAATQTAEARNFSLTLAAAFTPSPAVPTATAIPSAPTLTLAPTAVPAPTLITPTRTIAPTELKFCIDVRSIYVRLGPGTDFGAIGSLSFEDCLYFNGQNPDSTWLRISPDQDKYLSLGDGWVRSDLVRPQDFTQLPIIEPPTPTPTPEG